MGDLTPARSSPPPAKASIGIVCGLEAEAAVLGRWRNDPRLSVRISGANPDRAETAARELAGQGVRTLVSWGLAGGLSSALAVGALLRPSVVILPDGGQIDVGGGSNGDGAVLGSDTVITDPDEKRLLWERTAAIAVDMESHRLARVSRETGVGLRIIRAVSDPHDRALPELAAGALDQAGRPRPIRVFLGLLRRPWDLPALIAAKHDSDRALAALKSVADETISGLLAEDA